MSWISAVAVLAILFGSVLQAQTTSATSSNSAQALSLAAKSMQALTGGAQVSDATLIGTANQLNGVANGGSITLKARGYSEARLDGDALQEIRSLDANGAAQGQWKGADNNSHPIALHNSWTDAAWFLPALSSLSATSRPDVATSYLGQETLNSRSVQHLRFSRNMPGQTPAITAQIAQLSTVDIYLDSSSMLPVAMRFQTHPDNDFSTSFPVEVDYSDYRNVNGVQVPFRLQKYMNSNLIFDLSVSSASVNTGLSDSDFSIQ